MCGYLLHIDGTAEVARTLGAQVIEGTGSGAAAARNLGIAAATSESVLFTDGDCVPEPLWAERLLSRLTGEFVASKGIYRSKEKLVRVEKKANGEEEG